jgi:hypothetical protein
MSKQRLPLWILITLLSAGTPVVATDCEVPVYSDGFECGTARWSSAVGEDSPLPGPPIGFYTPELLCSWTGPPPGDPFPSHVEVIPTPLAADLPIGPPGSIEIVAVTYNGIDGGSAAGAGTDPSKFGVLRILDGATCDQLATVSDPSRPIIGASHPAVGDLDGDGILEIVALRAVSGLVAFRWNSLDSKFPRLSRRWIEVKCHKVIGSNGSKH